MLEHRLPAVGAESDADRSARNHAGCDAECLDVFTDINLQLILHHLHHGHLEKVQEAR